MSIRKLPLTVFCCLLLCAVAGAQITITENDISRTIGDSFQYKTLTSGSATVNVGSTGGPQVWTFDTAAFPGLVVVMEVVDKDSTPLGARFPDANITIQQVYGPYGLWVYRTLDADQMLDLGMAMSNGDTIFGFRYDPPGVNLDLPLTYGTQWQTTFGYTDTTSDTTRRVVLNNYDCRVDAWGTATGPAGTCPCLRENVFQTEITTEYLRGVIAWAETVLTRRFFWLGPAGGAVAMAHSMEGDTSSDFTVADDYIVLVQTNCGGVQESRGLPAASPVRIRPNPCGPEATLECALDNAGPLTVTVCDAAGRVVLRRFASSSQGTVIPLDLRGVPAGVYLCSVNAGRWTGTLRLVRLP